MSGKESSYLFYSMILLMKRFDKLTSELLATHLDYENRRGIRFNEFIGDFKYNIAGC